VKRREFLAGVAATLLVPRLASGDEPSLDEALARIAKARATLKTLAGPFTQTRHIGLLASDVKSNGTMTLVRPDRLRWELAPPDEVTYWVTPEGLAYRSRSGQGRIPNGGAGARLGAALGDLRVVLGGDLGALRTRYDLKLVPSADGSLAFEATPRDPAALRLQKIAFAVSSDGIRPVRATLVEGARDRTDIVFGALQVDAPVEPSRMKGP
jgi:outer membrane lipoprotein-sorting protein